MIKHTRYSGIHVSLGDMITEETKAEHLFDDHISTMTHWVNTEQVIVVHRDHSVSVFKVVEPPNVTKIERNSDLELLPYGGDSCGDMEDE